MTHWYLYEKLWSELCGKVMAGVFGSGELGWSYKDRKKHPNSPLPTMLRVYFTYLKPESISSAQCVRNAFGHR